MNSTSTTPSARPTPTCEPGFSQVLEGADGASGERYGYVGNLDPVWSGEVAVPQRAINRGCELYQALPADCPQNPSNHRRSTYPIRLGLTGRSGGTNTADSSSERFIASSTASTSRAHTVRSPPPTYGDLLKSPCGMRCNLARGLGKALQSAVFRVGAGVEFRDTSRKVADLRPRLHAGSRIACKQGVFVRPPGGDLAQCRGHPKRSARHLLQLAERLVRYVR